MNTTKTVSCTSLGYNFGFKIEPPQAGSTTHTVDAIPNQITVNISADVQTFTWQSSPSTFGIDAVIVKGGNVGSNVYTYDPEATQDSDSLSAPSSTNGSQPQLSHIEFCYDYEVQVSKDANTSLTRTWNWNIDKTGSERDPILALDESATVDYDVAVNATSKDSNWAASGTITLSNPTPLEATITKVTDSIGGIDAPVDCGKQLPFSLAAGGTVKCTYQAGLPNADTRTNTATVTTGGKVGGGSGKAQVDFGGATIEKVDECVGVNDDKYGSLGELFGGKVCANQAPQKVSYGLEIGAYDECGNYKYENTASFLTNDTEATDSDSWTVNVSVKCAPEGSGDQGCTPGYWQQTQHFGSWPQGYTQNTLVKDVFPEFDGVKADGVNLGNLTLLEALTTGGGGKEALVRHAVAAVLNAANSDVDYECTVREVKDLVTKAFTSGDIESVKNLFEAANEAGCPLARNEAPKA